MNRSVLLRGLAMMAGTVLFVIGCSAGTPTEGDLPPTKVATPEDMDKLQKKLLQSKVQDNAGYKPPPGVSIPKK